MPEIKHAEFLRRAGNFERGLDLDSEFTSLFSAGDKPFDEGISAKSVDANISKARVAIANDNITAALGYVRTALKGELDTFQVAASQLMQRYCLWRLAERDDFVNGDLIVNETSLAAYGYSLQSEIERDRLHTNRARRLAMLGYNVAGSDPILRVTPGVILSEIMYDEGLRPVAFFDEVGALGEHHAKLLPPVIVSAHLLSARVAQDEGRINDAFAIVHALEELGMQRHLLLASFVALAELLCINLDCGHFDDAGANLRDLDRMAGREHRRSPRFDVAYLRAISAARLSIATEHGEHALASQLNGLRIASINRGKLRHALLLSFKLGQLYYTTGQHNHGFEILTNAVRTAAGAGLRRRVMIELPNMKPFVKQLIERQDDPGCRDVVLYVLAIDQLKRQRDGMITSTTLLTQRERAIIPLLAEGLSNKEIARNLNVTPETIKSHLKHIFEKLRVATRAEAVARCCTIGLISKRS